MSFTDIQLKSNVLTILRSNNGIGNVNFKFGKYTFATASYLSVAAAIDAGKITCTVDSSQIPDGAAAIYDGDANIIVAKNADLRFNDDKASVVHEATHAYLDMLGSKQKRFIVKNLDNETCAYLAGALYLLALGQQPSPSGVKITVTSSAANIQDAAMEAVKKKAIGAGGANTSGPLDFTAKDVAKIQAAIKKNKIYKYWNTNQGLDGV